MSTQHSHFPEQSLKLPRAAAPFEQLQGRRWQFIGLALGAGVAAGVLLRYIGFRRALRLYLVARRFI